MSQQPSRDSKSPGPFWQALHAQQPQQHAPLSPGAAAAAVVTPPTILPPAPTGVGATTGFGGGGPFAFFPMPLPLQRAGSSSSVASHASEHEGEEESGGRGVESPMAARAPQPPLAGVGGIIGRGRPPQQLQQQQPASRQPPQHQESKARIVMLNMMLDF